MRSGKQHNGSGTSSTLHHNRLGGCYTIRHAGGVTRAADIIEQAVSTGQPVKADVR